MSIKKQQKRANQSCLKGHAYSCARLGDLKFQSVRYGSQPEASLSKYPSEDCWRFQKSIRDYKKSCEMKNSYGCHKLGVVATSCKKGKKALIYYKMACNLKKKKSCYTLGNIYTKNKNHNDAMYFFQQACNLKHSTSCNILGENEFKKKKLIMAKSYFQKACSNKHLESCLRLGQLEEKYFKNYKSARQFYVVICKRLTNKKNYNTLRPHLFAQLPILQLKGCFQLGHLEEKYLKNYKDARKYYALTCERLADNKKVSRRRMAPLSTRKELAKACLNLAKLEKSKFNDSSKISNYHQIACENGHPSVCQKMPKRN